MTISIIAGARPNFIKAAPLCRALKAFPGTTVNLIHTGQHRDTAMSGVFFKELGLPEPGLLINSGNISSTRQTARIMIALDRYFQENRPDWVVVIGDITSALAGALAAKQHGLRVAHVEAGLRSHDRNMPEELNRIAVDHLADLLFATERAAVENLRREGIPPERIHFAGNVLIDALNAILPKANPLHFKGLLQKVSRLQQNTGWPDAFALFTFHRPSNVDHAEGLKRIIDLIRGAQNLLPVIFPLHPRTLQQIKTFHLMEDLLGAENLILTGPVNYSGMVYLMKHARVVVTDSGGVQEETTVLGTPCLTFRTTTERPVTILYGTNTLIADRDPHSAIRQIELILAGKYKNGQIPPMWDGHTAERIATILHQH